MKSLVVTVAGMATRFSQSVGWPCLKCIYYKDSFGESLLNRLIGMNKSEFDNIIIVGGFMYEELKRAINNYLKDLNDKIILLFNEHFYDYGSGYSLFLGLKKAIALGSTEIVFAEGDLYIGYEEFQGVCSSSKDVVTTNSEPILAAKSVAFYFDKKEKIHYIFDTQHNELRINEPFTEIRNSGQVWKFLNMERLSQILESLMESEKRGTNLTIIQKYYGGIKRNDFNIINFKNWINCNTVNDFDFIEKLEKE